MRAVLAFAAANVCLAGCGALLDLPDDPRVAKGEHERGRRGDLGPATLLDPSAAAASPSGGSGSVSSPGRAEAAASVNDAGAARQPIARNAGDGAGAVASPKRDAGLPATEGPS